MRPTAACFAALLLALGLAACAATDPGSPALAFAQAATEGARAAQAHAQARAEANAALRRAVVASRADHVVLRGADCRPGAAPGACVPRLGPAGAPLGLAVPAGRPAELAAAIAAYADGLAAVAGAGSEAALEAALPRLAAALAGLSAPVPEAPGGIDLAGRRAAALRAAIAAADPPVRQALNDLAALVAGQREAAADDRAALLVRLVAQYNAMAPPGGAERAGATAAREALLGRIAALATAQRRLLADDPAPDLRALAEAHGRLREVAGAPMPETAALVAELARLADRLRQAADAARPPA